MASTGPKILTNLNGKLYVIGDIHGCVSELVTLLGHLTSSCGFTSSDQLIFIGDYIDRGTSSREVIETLVAFQKRFPSTLYLKGNHEEMMLQYLGITQGRGGGVFLRNGGTQTFKSYGIADNASAQEAIALLPPEHVAFLTSLERYIITDRFVFVHAGLHPLKDLLLQEDDDIYWIRQEFIRNSHRFGKTVVFGHTPFQEVFLNPPYKIGVDTGLVYGNKLTMIELTTGKTFSVRANSTKVVEGKVQL